MLERAEGGASTEAADRTWTQHAADVVYRFMPKEQVYAGVRYNKVNGTLSGIAEEVGANRWQAKADGSSPETFCSKAST